MPEIKIILDGDGAWPDLKTPDDFINAMGQKSRVAIAGLKGGMQSGNTSLTFRIDIPDSKPILFETSLALMQGAVRAFVGRYGEPNDPSLHSLNNRGIGLNEQVPVKIIKKADDADAVTRVSVGGYDSGPVSGFYCVYRGLRKAAIRCLERTLEELKELDRKMGDKEPPVSPDDGKKYA